MDRNITLLIMSMMPSMVALRKESVDRNREQFKYVVQCRVALRKESVDRNYPFETLMILTKQSLSARRAWIEMIDEIQLEFNSLVALRKESVDRNYSVTPSLMGNLLSLSARRAWIEI